MEAHPTASSPPPAATTPVEEAVPRVATASSTASTPSSEGHHSLHLPHVHLPHPHMPHVAMPHVPHPHMPEHLGESIAHVGREVGESIAHAGKEMLIASAYMGPGIALVPTGVPSTFQTRMADDLLVPNEQARSELEEGLASADHRHKLHKPEPKHTS